MSSSSGLKRARDDISNDETNKSLRADAPLPFGTFSGTCIYQNQLHSGETFQEGHVSIYNLVVEDCTAALITTFCFAPVSDQAWLKTIFSSQTDVTFVAHNPNGPNIGHATLQQLYPNHTNWRLIQCKPHTGGCLHPKLLLFRNSEGLRLVVSGNNFYQGQWQGDRDVMWIQDFLPTASSSGGGCSNGGEFHATLTSFLQDLVKCDNTENQSVVKERIEALLRGIDFHPAKGRLVVSFPTRQNQTRDRGGYRHLARAVQSFQNELDSHGSDNENDDCSQDKSHVIDIRNEGNIMYTVSGSMGDLKPDFLLQMYQAFACGQEIHAVSSTPWHLLYNKLKCLWPSRETALTMNLLALIGNGRSMSRSHWKNGIPQLAKRLVFLDALPNPREKGDLKYFPFAHCKAMYVATPHLSLVYVGSHNFSKAAWGIRGEMPKNVELGVVLATTSPTLRKEWKLRLPCVLPNASETSPPSYIPASAHSDIRNVLQQGNVKEAIKMTIEWLSQKDDEEEGNESDANDIQRNEPAVLNDTKRNAGSVNEKEKEDSHIIKADVVDLCDSD